MFVLVLILKWTNFFSLNNKKVKNTVTAAFGVSTEESTYEKSAYKNTVYSYVAKPEANVVVDANGYASISLADNEYLFVAHMGFEPIPL